MFKQIFFFELKYRATRPATYIYFGILMLLSYLTVLGMGQFFGNSNVSVGGSGGNTMINSPFVVYQVLSGLSFFAVLIISAIMGNPVYRDFDHQTHGLFYTYPITKFGYLGGRFAGSFVITFIVLLGLAIGFYLGTITPGINQEKLGPFIAGAYIQPYLLVLIPNLIFLGAVFFSIATITRNILSIYLGSVLFLVLYIVAASYMEDLENTTFSALIDPFGAFATEADTKYWTVAEKNTRLIPFSSLLIANRLIWIGVGIGLFALTFTKFRFSHFLNDRRKKKNEVKDAAIKGLATTSYVKLLLPKVQRIFSGRMQWKNFTMLTKMEFTQIVKNIYFIAIAAAGIILLIANSAQLGKMFGTTTYPVTYQVVSMLSGTFMLFFIIIITFYSGELIWKERSRNMNELMDTLPVPGWMFFTSKLTALILIQVLLLTVIMFIGILIQTFKGYFSYDIAQYLQTLYAYQLIDLVLLCVLSMVVQTLVNHKFIGYFIIIIYYLFDMFFMKPIGLEHNLYDYASDPGYRFSDMNGFGHDAWPYFVYKIYWGAFAVVLAAITNMFWVRGTETNFRQRWKIAKKRWSSHAMMTMVSLAVFILCGGFIFYNTNILNEYQTSEEGELEAVAFEKKYRKYNGIPQPRITDVKVNVDIFPKQRNFYFEGTYVLKNKHAQPIDSIHINVSEDAEIRDMSFDRSFKLVSEDKDFGYYIYRLDRPLDSGETVTLHYDLAYETKGFRNSGSNTNIVYNGTFINSGYMPSIGYDEGSELTGEDDRKEHGLPPRERLASVYDKEAVKNNYISNDADWVTFETVVSTSSDQIAIAPGYLQKEWTEGDRKYFHYKMDSKILNFYSFLSARYEVYRDKWKDVNIEIYYHKGHEYNIEKMVDGVKKSLEYFTENFSPYQHKQARIIEFPRYSSFAQSFPNTIPYSESIGFIAKVDENDPDDINYPFYITAHEIAHQWWAHQVIGGRVQGMTVMSETMAQYSALMVMEKEFGKEQMAKFLEYELDEYLMSRSFERRKELPLILNENQPYIHYRKGSVIMYALKDYIGEDSLNSALSKYLAATAFQEPPYTTSMEFLEYIRAATPDSLKYIIKDMFETITLYENKTTEASYREIDSNHYEVTFTVESKKFRADSLGNETEIPVSDWIDIAVLGREKIDGKWTDTEIYFKKHKITEEKTTFNFTVNKKPEKAGIDPYHKLIDRHLDDNTQRVVSKSES